MIYFEKVSLNEYIKSRSNGEVITEENRKKWENEWNNIKVPKRATSGSAGYDFYAPYDIDINVSNNFSIGGMSVYETIPTGIRFVTDRDDITLLCFPRSGHGFKKGLSLANTVGVIDSDYHFSDNGGHIMLKITAKENVHIKSGDGMMQGIIVPFIKVDNDFSNDVRNGGFGSTTKNS